MENINFYEQINLVLENKRPRKPPACECELMHVYAGLMHMYVGTNLCTQLRFQKLMKGKFLALKTKVWNESHIV